MVNPGSIPGAMPISLTKGDNMQSITPKISKKPCEFCKHFGFICQKTDIHKSFIYALDIHKSFIYAPNLKSDFVKDQISYLTKEVKHETITSN